MYDIIIVGGGPAGSTFARQAAIKGFKTLLLDKARFPREKPCGGGISIKALNELEIKIPEDIIERHVYGAALSYKTGDVLIGKSKKPVGITVSRKSFDSYLVKLAQNEGVNFLENTILERIEKKEDILTVYTTQGLFKSRYLIGADGSLGTTAKLSGIRESRSLNEVGLAFVAEYSVPSEIVENKFYGGDLLQITFLDILRGYAWVFPKRNSLNIGIGGAMSEKKNLLDKYKKFLNFFQKNNNISIDKTLLKAHIASVEGINREIASKNIFLVGDAAGFVDPFSGEGIYYAIKSAKIALDAILETEESPTKCNAGEIYQNKCNNDVIPSLKCAMRAATWFNKDQKKAFKILEHNPELALIFSKLAIKPDSYKEILRYMKKRMPYFLFRYIIGELGLLRKKRIIEEK